MKTSSKGRELIKEREGYRAHVYNDGFGFLTVGWGHRTKLPQGKLVRPEQAQMFFDRDIAVMESALYQAGVEPPTQYQFDAMVSLVFNIGPAAFAASETGELWRAGKYEQLPRHMLMWDHAGGTIVEALRKRRQHEVAQFRGEFYR